MRILAFITDGFGSSGGIARYNCDLMSALSQSSYVEQIVVLPRFGDIGSSKPDKVLQFQALSSAYSWAARSAYLAFRGGCDAVFCGHLNAAPFVARLARMAGKPLWLQAHGIEAWDDRGPQFRRALTQARLVTAVSRYTRRRMLSWGDVCPTKVRVLPNTFNQAYAPRERRGDLMSRYGIQGKKIILTVGRLSSSERYKGHDRIIRCLSNVRSIIPEAVYLIVGSGDDQPRLEELTCKEGVRDAVVFAGQVPAQEIVDHYSLSDVFAMPSTGEGFGIVFLEAAASGLPVIGGDQDGSLDALADGVLGMPVNPDDAAALSAAIIGSLSGWPHDQPEGIRRFASVNFSNHVDELVRILKS